MFTGIVSGVGKVVASGPGRLGVDHAPTADRLAIGSSVAVNGCCLTVVAKEVGVFFADTVPETLRRTNLGSLEPGFPVNLELPVTVNSLMDGHLVQGHVDGTARVLLVKSSELGREISIELPSDLSRFVAEKGSIAVDGVSLTVAGVAGDTFKVALIPHTLAATIAGGYETGSVVNLEVDVIARYVVRNLRG